MDTHALLQGRILVQRSYRSRTVAQTLGGRGYVGATAGRGSFYRPGSTQSNLYKTAVAALELHQRASAYFASSPSIFGKAGTDRIFIFERESDRLRGEDR